MPAYNFQPQFAAAVEQGHKRQTIRPRRKNPTKPGQPLMLFTGMRRKECRLLARNVCKTVEPIVIADDGVTLDGVRLSAGSLEALAKLDGFDSTEACLAFFRARYGLPFEGELIQW